MHSKSVVVGYLKTVPLAYPTQILLIIAMILFSVTAYLIDIPIGLAFSIGFASHLIIDLLNKSPERLFFPVKKRICFKVCYADRLGNELLFAVGAGFAVFYTLLFYN